MYIAVEDLLWNYILVIWKSIYEFKFCSLIALGGKVKESVVYLRA